MKKKMMSLLLFAVMTVTGCGTNGTETLEDVETETTTQMTTEATTVVTEPATKSDVDVKWESLIYALQTFEKDGISLSSAIENGNIEIQTDESPEYIKFSYNLKQYADVSALTDEVKENLSMEILSMEAISVALFALFGQSSSTTNLYSTIIEDTPTYEMQVYDNDDFVVGWEYNEYIGHTVVFERCDELN